MCIAIKIRIENQLLHICEDLRLGFCVSHLLTSQWRPQFSKALKHILDSNVRLVPLTSMEVMDVEVTGVKFIT